MAVEVAQVVARGKRRGLGNIRFLTGSLLDVAELAPGPYDYIDCCGVLHHLPDPTAGMRARQAEWLDAWAQALRGTAESAGAVEALRAELDDSRQALAAMQASQSWKLTAPLRYLARKLKSRP